MADKQDPRKEQYERARRAFEALKLEDKAFFLVQEAFSTVVRGVETAGRAVADEVEALFRQAENGETEPEAPKAGKKKTTRAKTSKTTTKKSRARKTPPKKSADKGGGAA